MISIGDYAASIKKKRANVFLTPYDLAYKAFENLGYDKLDKEYFEKNASSVVSGLRSECWKLFVSAEKTFTSDMLKELSLDSPSIATMAGVDAVAEFVEKYPEHIYSLTLSNTQSRRSRAGKEFEAIIEFVLIGAGIPIDSQGNIGKNLFIKKNLGKLVDLVIPGVVEYTTNKTETVLVSAKTTLRERWQEVPEEMSRTGASKMYLITLDDNISDNVLDILYESNIIVVTTAEIKEKYYPKNVHVISFEKLISECKRIESNWKDYEFSDTQLDETKTHLGIQLRKHKKHPYIKKYYEDRLNALS